MYFYGRGVAKDYAEGLSWMRKAADQGLTEAQENLGRIYANGYGVAKDQAEAEHWFELAKAGKKAGPSTEPALAAIAGMIGNGP